MRVKVSPTGGDLEGAGAEYPNLGHPQPLLNIPHDDNTLTAAINITKTNLFFNIF